ncbi:MazG nucleotide pyrophosphohydrolase domain-containing protein, partial [Lysobacter sp. D1-1-M9]
EDEIGDLLFVAANLARHARVDVGSALRRANSKFERRFRAMEAMARQRGKQFDELDLAAQERLWREVKQQE